MDRRPRYSREIVEPPILIPHGYLPVLEAVAIVRELIPDIEPCIAECTPAEHYLRSHLHRENISAIIQMHFNGKIYPLPTEAWAESNAPKIFSDGFVYAGGLEIREDDLNFNWWASVRINEDHLRKVLAEYLKNSKTNNVGIENKQKKPEITTNPGISVETPAVPPRSGAAGRPTSMHLILQEAERLCAEGAAAGSQLDFARSLSAWLRKTHPTAPQATPKAIQNNSDFRALHLRSKTDQRGNNGDPLPSRNPS